MPRLGLHGRPSSNAHFGGTVVANSGTQAKALLENCPDELVVTPQGPVFGGLQVVVGVPPNPSGFGDGVPNESHTSSPDC